MKNTRKDRREHAYGRARRLIRKVLHTENTLAKQTAIMKIEGIDYPTDYVEFQKYRRYRGYSNHGKCNPKHDRQRKVKGNRRIVLDKKIKDYIKTENKEIE